MSSRPLGQQVRPSTKRRQERDTCCQSASITNYKAKVLRALVENGKSLFDFEQLSIVGLKVDVTDVHMVKTRTLYLS